MLGCQSTRLSQDLARSVSANDDVVLTDRKQVSSDHDVAHSALGHDQATNELVRGMDVIVHSGEPDPQTTVSGQLDVAMRCTYNLLTAAVEEGVPRLIYLSSLSPNPPKDGV